MKNTHTIRQGFLDFFEQQGHRVMPSAPLIPPQDPTLMFTNSGMVQFKDAFLGSQKPPAPAVTTVQKCLRISGKHNDFDEVGFTNRHLTFFEMLGNFSFGKYFKEEAIDYAWTFLTQVCGLDATRLYATVHISDDEAADLWTKKIGLPPEKVIRFDADNFWQMADVGPCGPCTEIHYDLGDRFGPVGGENVVGGSGNRFVEIWNLVFMQFQKFPDGHQEKLGTPCVDTGMGLERLAMVLQGVESNFATEELTRITQAIEKIVGVKKISANQVSFHVVTDHVRSLLFLLHENIFPSNEGRGYVLRRIMRRALRFAGELGNFPNMLSSLLPEVARIYTKPYPGVEENIPQACERVREEENKFFDVVKRGSGYLDVEIQKLKQSGAKQIPGEIAFKLHDTYGFPIDLTRVVGKQHRLAVDEKGFEVHLGRQKDLSRQKSDGGDVFAAVRQESKRLANIAATSFLGYETLRAEAVLVDAIPVHDQWVWVFDKTPFYATGGGQVGDVGVITDFHGKPLAQVKGTERLTDQVIGHWVALEGAEPAPGMALVLQVDEQNRADTMAHHTATHLLHKALQVVLGSHVRQQGSYVGPDQLRFDFSHHKKMTDEEKAQVAAWVNERIEKQLPVTATVTSIEDARRAGAMMFFGEKYGNQVRQLAVGKGKQPESLELCGGTHVANTADIGGFELVSEQSIAQGIRRIVALSGSALMTELKKRAEVGEAIAKALQTTPEQAKEAVERLQQQSTAQRKALEHVVGELLKAWQVQVKQEGKPSVHVFELPEVDLPKTATKQVAQLPVVPESVVVVVFGPKAERRFSLVFGSGWKTKTEAAKKIFEAWTAGLKLQGGGGGLQFQGACPDGVTAAMLKQNLETQLHKGT